MNSLKAALGKDDKKIDKLMSNMSISKNKFSNSKSQSMWAFQNDDKNVQISLDNDQKLDLLNNLLKTAYEKDIHISPVTFDRIVEDFQQQMSTSSNKSELSHYLFLEDKTTDLIDIFGKINPQYAKYLQQFHEKVEEKIANLRNKDRSNQLKNFDKIVGNNNNFKKKVDYLDIEGIKPEVCAKSRQKHKHEKDSNQKLTRLLSKEKEFKQKETKKHHHQEDPDDYLLSQTMQQNNESVSYSAIMSTSVAVKQRRPRKKSTKPEDFNFKTQLKNKKSVQNEEEGEKTDKAFIFFRPRKTSKY